MLAGKNGRITGIRLTKGRPRWGALRVQQVRASGIATTSIGRLRRDCGVGPITRCGWGPARSRRGMCDDPTSKIEGDKSGGFLDLREQRPNNG